MRSLGQILVFVALLLLPASFLSAQTAVDPSGHWEGAVQIRASEMRIEVDIAKNGKGEFAGTYGQPEQGVGGLPLSTVELDGRTVRFVVKANASEPATFEGVVSEDGYTISGDVSQLGFVVPFSLTWKAVAKIVTVAKSAAIGKELEGTWNGTIETEGIKKRLILKMTNQPDGTAVGTIVSPDGSGVEIAIAMTQNASRLTIEVPQIVASFDGTLGADGKELAGTWTQSGTVVRVTFQRSAN